MRLARHLGLPVAEVETITVSGRALLVVARYDRAVDPDGHVERIHQEDFCQATGTPPERKYEEDGGPPLRTIARMLSNIDPNSLVTLLRAITVHVLVGNGDAHAKNYSLLHEPSGALRLAPLYDVMSTHFYNDNDLAMYIDGVRKIDRVTLDRLVNEASSWGMSPARASGIVGPLLEAVPTAVEVARAETPGPLDEILQFVGSQLERLR